MSEPPNTSTTTPPPNIVTVTPYPAISYKTHHLPPTTAIIHHGGATTSTITTNSNLREYRKGNWTLEETLVLITAKKLDDERRINATTPNLRPATGGGGGGELRWKWVENYCWSNGCLRSQNQCNDKWDNLLRDYKKVREYELRSPAAQNRPSYWSMDKSQRKERNLPSNLLLNIYEALNDVVQKKLPNRHSIIIQQQQQQQQPPLAVLPPAALPPPETTHQPEATHQVPPASGYGILERSDDGFNWEPI